MPWDINSNAKAAGVQFRSVEAPFAIEACRAAMPDRKFELEYRAREGCWQVVEAGTLTTHEVWERRRG